MSATDDTLDRSQGARPKGVSLALDTLGLALGHHLSACPL